MECFGLKEAIALCMCIDFYAKETRILVQGHILWVSAKNTMKRLSSDKWIELADRLVLTSSFNNQESGPCICSCSRLSISHIARFVSSSSICWFSIFCYSRRSHTI